MDTSSLALYIDVDGGSKVLSSITHRRYFYVHVLESWFFNQFCNVFKIFLTFPVLVSYHFFKLQGFAGIWIYDLTTYNFNCVVEEQSLNVQ